MCGVEPHGDGVAHLRGNLIEREVRVQVLAGPHDHVPALPESRLCNGRATAGARGPEGSPRDPAARPGRARPAGRVGQAGLAIRDRDDPPAS